MGPTDIMWTSRESRPLAATAFCLAAALVCGARQAGAGAQAPFDPYAVLGYRASAEGESGVAAKEAALDAALRKGFVRVLRRVAPAGTAARLAAGDRVGDLLDRMAIQAEKVAPRAYRATVDIHFSPISVRGYLARHGVPVVDEPAPPVLLIPVLTTDRIPAIWDDAAAWSEALAGIDMAAGLTPVRLPRNSAEDRLERLGRLLDGDRVSLDTFRVRYRVQGVVVVNAVTVAGRDHVEVTLTGEDAAGPVEETLDVEAGGLPAAAKAVAARFSERWKTSVGGTGTEFHEAGALLAVRVLLHAGPGEWGDIRRRLEASGAVIGVAVEGRSELDVNILLWHDGPPAGIVDKLASQRLDLFEAGGTWLLQAY